MKHSLFRFSVIVALALSVCAAVATAVLTVSAAVVTSGRRLRDLALDVLLRLVPAKAEPTKRSPPVLLVAAKAFTSGLLRRTRPTVREQWRMCPSV